MGRRYYCEYCDKTFPDNPTNRKNHLKGIQHRALIKQHYDFYRDPEVILTEDSRKRPCRAFQQDGNCKFGSACIYSHLRIEDRERLVALVAQKQASLRTTHSTDTHTLDHTSSQDLLSDWLEKRAKRLKAESSAVSQTSGRVIEIEPEKQISFSLPDCLRGIDSLPPSLLPPDTQAMNQTIDCEWG